MEPLTIGSLFSGIGGLDLGIERGLASAGVAAETIWQVEQSDYCRRVLSRHWPHAERYTDVRTITASSVDPVDILCGGFPCQDISTAGKGAGLAGEKSGLFFEMARIVRELEPRIVVMENVPAIRTRGLDVVLRTMAALGYDARWGGLRASEVGAHHRRERWFCVCWLADNDRQRGTARARLAAGRRSDLPDPDRSDGRGSSMADSMRLGHAPLKRVQRESDSRWTSEGSTNSSGAIMADSIGYRPQGQQPAGPATGPTHRATGAGEWGPTQSEVGRGIAGIPARLDSPHRWPAPPGPQHAWEPPRTRPRQPHDRERLKALGNAVVPQCAAVIGHWIGSQLIKSA